MIATVRVTEPGKEVVGGAPHTPAGTYKPCLLECAGPNSSLHLT